MSIYEIGNHVTENNVQFIVSDIEHWDHEDMGPQVTIMGRRFIKSRNAYATNAGQITTMSLDYYNKNYRV